MNSDSYIKLIDEQLQKFGTAIGGQNYIFQQDNAIHTAKNVKNYFSENNIQTLKWPSRSPDLNIIENCWSKLARAVYINGRQFKNTGELKIIIKDEWDKLDQTYLKTLYESLPKRMVEVLTHKGASTHY